MKRWSYALVILALVALACLVSATSESPDIRETSPAPDVSLDPWEDAAVAPLGGQVSADSERYARAAAALSSSDVAARESESGEAASAILVRVELESAAWVMAQGEGSSIRNRACSVEARQPGGSLVKRNLRSDARGRASTTLPREFVTIGPEGKATNVIVRLVATAGGTARGVVIGRLSGAPVPIDSLGMFGSCLQPMSLPGRRAKDTVQWTEDGRFEVHFTESCELDLLVRSFGHGSGSLSQAPLDVAQPPQDLLLEVGGPARILGVLTDSRGRAPLPTKKRAVARRLQGERWSPYQKCGRTEAEREGAGLLDATTWSQTCGTFEFAGLRLGDYAVLAELPLARCRGYLTLGEAVAVPAPETMAIVFDVPHLVVSLVGAYGRPWEPKVAQGSPLRFAMAPGATSWPAEPTVVVRDAGPIGAPHLVGEPGSSQQCAPDKALSQPHRKVYRVPEDRQYQVCVVGGAFASSVQYVTVPRGGERALSGRALRGPGHVEALRDPAPAQRLLLGVPRRDSRISEPQGVLLSGSLGPDGAHSFHLPRGDYLVRVRGAPTAMSHVAIPSPDISYTSRRVRVVEGQAQHQLFVLRGGRVLEVTVGCETPSVTPARRDGSYGNGAWGSGPRGKEADAVENPRCIAALALLHPSGEVEVLQGPASMASVSAHSFLASAFPSGRTWTTTAVSTGTFTLYARLQDGRKLRQPISIAEGTTTPVTIAFD